MERGLDGPGAEQAYARMLEIESTSWKGREGIGITKAPMRNFYEVMVALLAERGRLRVTWAMQADRPVGYVLGGVFWIGPGGQLETAPIKR